VLSVGQWVIRQVPPAVEDWAIGAFGRRDKVVLVAGVVLVALLLGALVGWLASRSFRIAAVAYPIAGLAGAWAALADGGGAPVSTGLSALAAVGTGLFCLYLLQRSAPEPGDAATADAHRRDFLGLIGGIAGVGVVSVGAARLLTRLAPVPEPGDLALATPAKPLSRPTSPGEFEDVPGLTAFFTPNRDFYRIDTALALPRVDLERWRLRIKGLLDTPYELSYDDLSALPQIEADITLSCVSNEVGGSLVGNARWQGIPLVDLLDRAGVQPGATQIVGRSVDGWTAGFPTALAVDGRPAMVALGMNGEPLPLAHGFPARLVVPGLYGYVSATKWLSEIELTTIEAFDGYWVPRGWSKLGDVKLQSRIDTPRSNQTVPAGTRVVAGVAWAPRTGIAAVEVSFDDGPWQTAVLSDQASTDTWRQWRHEWDATPGRHRISARAIDGRGQVQVPEARRPRPEGATGHHTVMVMVR
jgi:DMSO/TMAO reductase YedYZ molybdopterin-dependent catalytic subunit